ncbi:MAG: LysR substrate-binding domain-containing protein [Gammaproteobacteria bacterium]
MRANFTFRRLEYFIAVGETGSVAGASGKLNVSPPSISAALVQLEEELGVQLFIRRRAHGMALTSGGRRLFYEAKKVLRHAGNLQNIATDLYEQISGVLRVGCLQTVAPLILPWLRKDFEAKFPRVRVCQTEDHHAGLLAALQNADIDLALTYDLNISANIHFEPLASLPPYAMFAPEHPLSARRTVTLADLAPEPLILLDLPLSSTYFLSMFKLTGIVPRITERSKDMALVRSMVANGFGYSLGNVRPRPEIAPDGKRLKHVPLKNNLRPMRLGLAVCRTDNYTTRAAEAFCENCRNMITTDTLQGMSTANADGAEDDR